MGMKNIKFAAVTANNGDTTLVAAVSGKKIRVVNAFIIPTGVATMRFESGTGGAALTGVMTTVSGTPFNPGYCGEGHFETAVGQLLNLEFIGIGLSCAGFLSYVEV